MRAISKLRAQIADLFGKSAPPVPMNGLQLHLFTVYLDTMLRCGMSLAPALNVLTAAGESESRYCARQVVKDVESGYKLSQALGRHPESFPATYARVIETAEQTGRLTESLGRLALSLDKQNQTTRRLTAALVYPIFLVLSSITMVTVMLYFVFPMVIKVTQDAGVDPPALTQALIRLTTTRSLGLIVLGVLVVCLFLWRILTHARTGPFLRRLLEEFFPPVRFYAQTQVLNSIRQLAMMLESGLDLVKALRYANHIGEGSVLVREAFEDIIRRVRTGDTLVSCMERHPVFPKTLTAMVSVSDYAGDAQVMLNRFCDLYEENLNNQLDAVTSLIEPILLASMGVVIGTILLAAFLPIYNLIKL